MSDDGAAIERYTIIEGKSRISGTRERPLFSIIILISKEMHTAVLIARYGINKRNTAFEIS